MHYLLLFLLVLNLLFPSILERSFDTLLTLSGMLPSILSYRRPNILDSGGSLRDIDGVKVMFFF